MFYSELEPSWVRTYSFTCIHPRSWHFKQTKWQKSKSWLESKSCQSHGRVIVFGCIEGTSQSERRISLLTDHVPGTLVFTSQSECRICLLTGLLYPSARSRLSAQEEQRLSSGARQTVVLRGFERDSTIRVGHN